jgi:D,D-heptose 1,7-bisphosphate phosphatase
VLILDGGVFAKRAYSVTLRSARAPRPSVVGEPSTSPVPPRAAEISGAQPEGRGRTHLCVCITAHRSALICQEASIRGLGEDFERGDAVEGHGGPSELRQWRAACGSGEVPLNTALPGEAASVRKTGKAGSRPGILLDRDGTIIVDHGYVGSVDRVEFIDGAPEAIALFNKSDIPVAVITNQAGIARGLYRIDDVRQVHHYIADRLAEHGAHVDLFLYCPYHPDGVIEDFARTSEDRKPRPGMARAAEAALNLDLAASWVVGDRPEDIGLAQAIGATAVYLGRNGFQRPGVWSFPSLTAAAPFIMERIAV